MNAANTRATSKATDITLKPFQKWRGDKEKINIHYLDHLYNKQNIEIKYTHQINKWFRE